MSSSQTNATTAATAVNHHHRNNKANAKVVQRTTSESLRLSMNSNCIDGNVLANGNTNFSSGLTANSVGSTTISNNLQNNTQQTFVPPTATLLMTNNGKFQTNSTTTSAFVTLPDINMDMKPKTSSYQITSITVGTRTSADEDSADDLDESHTTDENSRVTDMENETPSYSEDSNMYSKDDVFATAYAHGIPIMQNNMSADLTNCVNSNQVGKKLPDVRVNCVTTAVDKNKGVEIKGSERFKVVKIESIEPFKRGRWTCMDYLDQSAKQVQMNFGGNGKTVATNDSGVVLTENFNDTTMTTKQKKQAKTVQTEMLPNQNQNAAVQAAHLISGQSAPAMANENTSPGQTLQQPLQNSFANVVNNQNMQSAAVLQSNTVQEVHQQQQQQQQLQQQQQQQPQQQQQQQQPQQHQTQPVAAFHHPVGTHNVQQGQSLPPQIMSHVIPQMQQNHQIQATPNAVQQHQMAVSHGQLPNFQPQQQQQQPQQQPQQYSNTSMGGSQSAHNTQTIPMQQIHEIHQYQQQYQNNLQNQQAAQQYYNQIATDNSNNVYQKPQMQQQQQQPQYQAQMQQFSGQYQQQMPTNQQQFQAQTAMPTQQQMQMQSQQQPQVSYPHGQTLPANALQGIVTTGTHMAGLPIASQIPPTMVNVSHQQAMSMGHLPNNIELNMNMPSGMNPMAVNHSGYIPQQQVPHSQQAQMHSQPTSVVSSSMHIQPQNQNYANQNQTIASNVAAVPYSIGIQATHDANVMQQATSQMNNVNQSNVNLQPNYVNSAIPTQPTQSSAMIQQTQPVLVHPIQATAQQTVVTNPNRNNVISSETGNAAQNISNVITSSSSNIAPNVGNTNNVNASVTNANVNNTINDPDTVSVDGPTKMPVVNATATDDGQSVDESESHELESPFFVLPLNEITLEPSEKFYTNMVMQNPLENPTNLATVTTENRTNDASTSSNCVAQNFTQSMPDNAMRAGSQPPSTYTTQSLTSPIKGIIPRLQREESEGIPIPGRAQSHDDIRLFGTGSGYNSPNSNYCISPNSPRGQYMYGCSPVGMNSSPPINYNSSSYLTKGGYSVARRVLSRATSPLSSSVPGNNTYINAPNKFNASTNNRNIAVSNNCSSTRMVPFDYAFWFDYCVLMFTKHCSPKNFL
ncbi:putative mediator of RNA polymerase II transcription subunit 26 isoform X2 [Sitodiplosis mosellana]|uniref:putative mediator of RNA polymerase II transcription subunit 26 isoform X2 n=1 Tax=Sitodiplosis mosellana TaxID=263140 RepID=UPI00244539B7|nr:putative mediator of RNA polymerase II transcription subunit 26 isoform X2 [Sitodiplosis mosellana]